MNPLYRLVFDNARSRFGKIAVASLIGATVALMAIARDTGGELRRYWVVVTLGGAAAGLLASLILTMADARTRRPSAAAGPHRESGRYVAVTVTLAALVVLVVLTSCIWTVFV